MRYVVAAPAVVPPLVAALVAAVVAGGCAEPTPPPAYLVGGTVDGLWDGDLVRLRLEHGDQVELVDVATNGAFQFAAALTDGEPYLVTVANGRPCAVADGAGVVAGRDVDAVAVRCAAPVDVRLSDPAGWRFDPVPARTDVDLTILTQRVTVTVDAPGMEVAIDGAPATSGAPVVRDVALDAVPLRVDLTDGARHRRYELTLRRGARVIEAAGAADAGEPAFPGLPVMFGQAIALAEAEVFVGAPWVDGASSDEGAIRRLAWDRTALTADAWSQASPARFGAEFGAAVAIDGDRLVIGAPREAGGVPTEGAAYVFRRTATGWRQVARLASPAPGFDDQFGAAVAIQGATILVGAPSEDSAAQGIDGDATNDAAVDSGAVYVFRETAVDAWAAVTYVKAPERVRGFGNAVALDGDVAVIGAAGSGRAYAMRRAGDTWSAGVALVPTTPSTNLTGYGVSVAISGGVIAVGDPFDSGVGPGVDGDAAQLGPTGGGAVHLFRDAAGAWRGDGYIKASRPLLNDNFGMRVAILGDVLLVGAPSNASAASGVGGDDLDTSLQSAGAVYVLHHGAAGWVQDAFVKPPTPRMAASFGAGLALSRTGAVCGAPRDLAGGAIYAFR